VARSIFDRYSFDLIYARPRQTLQAWCAELKRAIAEAEDPAAAAYRLKAMTAAAPLEAHGPTQPQT